MRENHIIDEKVPEIGVPVLSPVKPLPGVNKIIINNKSFYTHPIYNLYARN